MSEINGRISQIIGPVIDVYFESEGKDSEKVLPKIYEALKIKRPDGSDLIVEVQQHRRIATWARSSACRFADTHANR